MFWWLQVLHCQGRAKVCLASTSVSCLLLTCRPLPLSHTLLSTHTFTSQHSMDMRFTYCDQRYIKHTKCRVNSQHFFLFKANVSGGFMCRVTSLLGYRPEELLGRSIYDLCHTLDTSCLNKNHLNRKRRRTQILSMEEIMIVSPLLPLLQCVWRVSPSAVSTGCWSGAEVMSGWKVTAPSSPASSRPGPEPVPVSHSASFASHMSSGVRNYI